MKRFLAGMDQNLGNVSLLVQRYLTQDNITNYTCVCVTFLLRHAWVYFVTFPCPGMHGQENNENTSIICNIVAIRYTSTRLNVIQFRKALQTFPLTKKYILRQIICSTLLYQLFSTLSTLRIHGQSYCLRMASEESLVIVSV